MLSTSFTVFILSNRGGDGETVCELDGAMEISVIACNNCFRGSYHQETIVVLTWYFPFC